MTETQASRYSVRAAQRVLDILDLVQSSADGVTLAQVAAATGMPKSSAFRYLATLEERGYLERDPGIGTYYLGVSLRAARGHHLEMLAARARPVLERLCERFGETVNLGVLDGCRVAYLEIVEPNRGMRFAARKGDREPIHSTALGKAIASLLDEGRVREILALEGMPQRTARTITDPGRFLEVVDQVRRAGFAIDDRENEEDGRCVAVPLAGVAVPAALSLSAPAARFSLDAAHRTAPALVEAAEGITEGGGG